MKKNISINISGIIFHIEEDGYETLKKYLDSINKYFSSFEDSSEILADIESRIAEIFLSKLNEEKQIITAEDVSALVATMGSVSDFKAAEDEDTPRQETAQPKTEQTEKEPEPFTQSTSENQSTGGSKGYAPPKQLVRDQKRKILGGVCTGIAHYMNVDAVWIRLLFALLAFAYGLTFFAYIILWIVLPGSYELEETETEKKLFRDSAKKVIGGVSGGLAAYLNIDIVAVRVLFIVLTLAGGLGFLVYVVLWVILPETRSLTDKMQMQGEAVTLSNIESTIKKNQSERGHEETTVTKIILFPFRLIGTILSALGKIIVPLLEVIRVAVGILIVIVGIGFVFTTVVAGSVALGILSGTSAVLPWFVEHGEMSVPLEALGRSFPGWIALAGFIGALIPSVFLILLGLSVIARKIVFSATVGWSLFALFFICVALLSVGIPKIVFAFKEYGEYKTEMTFEPSGTTVLRINEIGMDDFHGTHLTLKGYDGKVLKVVEEFNARGSTRQKAIENAKMVEYNVNMQDSVLSFDSNLTFKQDAEFRDQRVNLTLYIPYNLPFVMEEGVSRFITQYINWEYLDGHTWKMSEEKGLECVSCPPEKQEDALSNLSDFSELEISGKFDVRVTQGYDYSIELIGPENEKQNYNIFRSGETLVIEYEGKKKIDWDNWKLDDLRIEEMKINITMPNLDKIEASGIGSVRFEEFTMDQMDIEVRGPIKLRGQLHAQSLNINLTGKAEADLSGSSTRMNADIEFASKLKAYNLEVVDAIVEVNGASNAKVNVSGTLEIDKGVASDVDYHGQPHIVKHED